MMHAWNERLTFPKLLDRVINSAKTWKIDRLLIENRTSGAPLYQEIRRSLSTEEFALQLMNPRGDKWNRLSSVQHIFSEGMVWAPDKAWSEMVIRQVGSFPRGKHDDLVDAVAYSLRWLRDSGMLTRAPERLYQIEDSKLYRGKAPEPLYPA